MQNKYINKSDFEEDKLDYEIFLGEESDPSTDIKLKKLAEEKWIPKSPKL